jgi:DNA (cytosine-5)-methyltransferase 1
MREFTAIDLFSGCGGLTLGLKQAGFRVLAAIENDKNANQAFSKNHGEVLLKRRNISRIPVWLENELKLISGDRPIRLPGQQSRRSVQTMAIFIQIP